LSPVSLPVTSSLPHPGQELTSMPNPYQKHKDVSGYGWLSHCLCCSIKAYLCRTLGRECSLKACLVPFLSQMDSLISGILASNKFFTTAGTGSHINAQSLSSARLNGVSVILHTFAGPLAGKAISKQALCHSLPKWTVLSPVSLPVTSSLPHPGQAVTSMPNPYRVQG